MILWASIGGDPQQLDCLTVPHRAADALADVKERAALLRIGFGDDLDVGAIDDRITTLPVAEGDGIRVGANRYLIKVETITNDAFSQRRILCPHSATKSCNGLLIFVRHPNRISDKNVATITGYASGSDCLPEQIGSVRGAENSDLEILEGI